VQARLTAGDEPRRASHDTPSGRRGARAARRGVGSIAWLYGSSSTASSTTWTHACAPAPESPPPARAHDPHPPDRAHRRCERGRHRSGPRSCQARAESGGDRAANDPRRSERPPQPPALRLSACPSYLVVGRVPGRTDGHRRQQRRKPGTRRPYNVRDEPRRAASGLPSPRGVGSSAMLCRFNDEATDVRNSVRSSKAGAVDTFNLTPCDGA